MKISKFFKAKKVSDRCQQYKNNYEKIIVLKQGFDAALENGVKSRNFDEAKSVKIELEKVIFNLKLDLKFKVWETIELGTGLKTGNDFRRAFKESNYGIMDYAASMMDKPEFTVSSEKTKFKLVKVTVAELGFPEGATLEEIYKRAQEMGLELCPPEVGPQLLLQRNHQSGDGEYSVAMEAIKDSDGLYSVFNVARAVGVRWLDTLHGRPDNVWHADRRLVFVRRK